MADIFISYARSIAPQAQAIAEALRALGYGVWRDDELPAHRAYAEVIEERLKAAKAVVVIWSAEAVKSEWVRAEADLARGAKTLVQLSLDGATLPLPFNQIQCADLAGWSGDTNMPGWRKVAASIADLVGGASPAATPGPLAERKGLSICVLPFANMSNDAEQEYFADGISEDIITDLSKVSALAVISRNSAFAFKGKHVDLPQVAKQLNVSHVLEGSVRKSGNRVRITAQLINGATNDHVWAERYDRSLDDIFALQDEISEAIVTALKLKLFPKERKAIEQRGTTNVEAYDKYLRARALFNQGGSAELTRAAQIYREVLALDPDFALAWYGLYTALAINLNWVSEKFAAARKEMDEAGAHIEALAPDAWWTLAMRAEQLRLQHKWAEAEVASQIALAAAPASEVDPIRICGLVLADIGRIEEAVELSQRALQVDPLSLGLSARLQYRLDFAGRPEEARAEYERSKDLAGDRSVWEFYALMRIWRNKDAAPAAVKAQFQVCLKHATIPMTLNHVMVDLLDNRTAARAAIRQAYEDPANQDAMRMHTITYYADHFGDRDLALAAVRRGMIELNIPVVSALLWFPFETGLRADPRFKQIVRELGLYDYWRASGKWGDFARPLGDDDFEIIR
jgi:adenylate cyclase